MIIVEVQTNDQGVSAVLTDQASDENQADSNYYSRLSSAAISNVKKHTVFLLSENGACIKSKCYTH